MGETRLFIDNLHNTINDNDLYRYFSKYGRIIEAYVVRGRLTKISRAYGYVDFYYEYSAENVMHEASYRPHMIRGRYITVCYASDHAAENREIHGETRRDQREPRRSQKRPRRSHRSHPYMR